jgi:hypothetical protein
MLIDSGSEMNVMSKGLWGQAQDLLPIGTDIRWSIGSANSMHDQVYGVCHSVMVDISGMEKIGPVFVLEGASQQFILGKPWKRQARAQYDNREDGSLYISITSTDSKRRAIFCAVAEHSERNWDRVHILRIEEPEGEENASRGRARVNADDVSACRAISMVDRELEVRGGGYGMGTDGSR